MKTSPLIHFARVVAVSAAVACTAAIPAMAAPILLHPLSSHIEGAFSNTGGQEIANAIMLDATASVSHLSWYGYFTADLSPSVTTHQFIINLWQDAHGVPGETPLYSRMVYADVQSTGVRMSTPFNPPLDNRLVYAFDIDLPAPIPIVADTPDWLSIVNTDFSNGGAWLWARTSFEQAPLAYRTTCSCVPDHSWTSTTFSGQMAFELDGTQTSPVPEPSTWSLLVCGLLGTLMSRIRSRRGVKETHGGVCPSP